jgi:hypothetical protein
MQRRPPIARGAGIDLRAHDGIRWRQRGQTVAQRLEIEHCAAAENRNSAAITDPGDRRKRVAAEPRCRIGFRGIDDVEQMVRHAGKRCRVRLRRADVHAPINLRRVHADDLPVEPLGKRLRECALARGRGAHQQDRRQLFIAHA